MIKKIFFIEKLYPIIHTYRYKFWMLTPVLLNNNSKLCKIEKMQFGFIQGEKSLYGGRGH